MQPVSCLNRSLLNNSIRLLKHILLMYFSIDHLSEWFKDGGNYTVYLSYNKGQISCMGPVLQNSPMDSNIRMLTTSFMSKI